MVFGSDVYSSSDDVLLDQTLLDNRLQEIEDALKNAPEELRVNRSLITLNVSYEPYEGEVLRRVAGYVFNCSQTTIVVITIYFQSSDEQQKKRFVSFLRNYASLTFLRNSLDQLMFRCTIQTVIEEDRLKFYTPNPPNAPPIPFVDVSVMNTVGLVMSVGAVGIVGVCGLTGQWFLAALRTSADLVPYWVRLVQAPRNRTLPRSRSALRWHRLTATIRISSFAVAS